MALDGKWRPGIVVQINSILDGSPDNWISQYHVQINGDEDLYKRTWVCTEIMLKKRIEKPGLRWPS